jgi:hypothetical protein
MGYAITETEKAPKGRQTLTFECCSRLSVCRPFGACSFLCSTVPTANAVGYTLPPLAGADAYPCSPVTFALPSQPVERSQHERGIRQIVQKRVRLVSEQVCCRVQATGGDGDGARPVVFGAGDVVGRIADDDQLLRL